MVLRKSAGSTSCSSILGLKVVGGKLLEDGSMGALIEKVKKGSTADVEGQLRPGKRITKFELNSENFQNAQVTIGIRARKFIQNIKLNFNYFESINKYQKFSSLLKIKKDKLYIFSVIVLQRFPCIVGYINESLTPWIIS